MIHHLYNPSFEFVHKPVVFDKNTDRGLLQYCLGATLYMPGTKEIIEKIINKNILEYTSMVMCCEDAIDVNDLSKAEDNILKHLSLLSKAVLEEKIEIGDIPLTFVRVRNPEQFRSFASRLNEDHVQILSGIVFPKFTSYNGADYLSILYSINQKYGCSLYCMPLLEGRDIAFKEIREKELLAVKQLLSPFQNLVLNIRIGGTDLSSLFAVRRGINYSIYDILTVKDCLTDIVNYFGRVDDDYTISGPVWEYFLAYTNDSIDQILEKNIHLSLLNRHEIINEAIDGLLREVILDKANGFVGKTIIHPSHARFVNAMQAVTKEEYDDAEQILKTSGGVIKSKNANKMNEINPHRSWAQKTHYRAQAYGVVPDGRSYLKLIMGNS
ncbi:MAG: HpcH/HpaI aldolase/citrate lyase family protein [Balneolales bacterium]|nr:HpcH/HpaI aldolase/citrate lyase family protein [Balneolales bacterium]